jgi:hypothetical protein
MDKIVGLEIIIKDLKAGSDVLVKGDGYKYHTDIDTILRKALKDYLTENQIIETATDILNLDLDFGE